MTEFGAFTTLFLSAFLSATLLPGSSEAALVALLVAGKGSPAVLIAVATAGNVLGSCANWLLGRFFAHFRDRRWFPVSPRSYDRAIGWYKRYGVWSLLFAWVPVIGDPLTLAAGVMRADLRWFIPLVTIGKLARYLAIAAGFLWWSQ
ncbi:MAG TPA: YqaA family protein [Xanthobacteraceae bacterium]|nr:YqaA family protein [Xanthobacteraceae bacterium]